MNPWDPLTVWHRPGIQEVRNRAGLTPLAGLDQSALRDAIVHERMQEFTFEQVMYPELRRKSTLNGTADYLGDHIKHIITTYSAGREDKARDYVLPIPKGNSARMSLRIRNGNK